MTEPGWKRWAASAFAVLLVYANVSVILWGVGARVPVLPATHDGFMLFGVFHTFEDINRETILEGRDASGDWVKLDIREHVPYELPERNRRLNADRVAGPLSFRTSDEAHAFLLRKIRERHNRLHADRPVDAVRIVILTWPRHEDQYMPRIDDRVRRRVVASEEQP